MILIIDGKYKDKEIKKMESDLNSIFDEGPNKNFPEFLSMEFWITNIVPKSQLSINQTYVSHNSLPHVLFWENLYCFGTGCWILETIFNIWAIGNRLLIKTKIK
jgi:hypothetical protein